MWPGWCHSSFETREDALLRMRSDTSQRSDTHQNGFVTIPPSTRSAAPLVALEAFEQT